jgi:hypothetical protein
VTPRAWKIAVAVAVVAGVAIYFATRQSDEARIRGQLAKLAALVRVTEDDAQTNPIGRLAHVDDALAHLVDRDVRVNVPELPSALGTATGREALGQLIASEPRFVRKLDLDFSRITVKLDDAHTSALVGLIARVRGKEADGADHDDERAVDMRFAREGGNGEWVVTTLSVWSPGDARPE